MPFFARCSPAFMWVEKLVYLLFVMVLWSRWWHMLNMSTIHRVYFQVCPFSARDVECGSDQMTKISAILFFFQHIWPTRHSLLSLSLHSKGAAAVASSPENKCIKCRTTSFRLSRGQHARRRWVRKCTAFKPGRATAVQNIALQAIIFKLSPPSLIYIYIYVMTCPPRAPFLRSNALLGDETERCSRHIRLRAARAELAPELCVVK